MQKRHTPSHIGRIRINEDEANLLLDILYYERQALLGERKEAKEAGKDLLEYQQDLAYIRRIYNELINTAYEKGWRVGQPERFEQERTDSPISAEEQERMGRRNKIDHSGSWWLRGLEET